MKCSPGSFDLKPKSDARFRFVDAARHWASVAVAHFVITVVFFVAVCSFASGQGFQLGNPAEKYFDSDLSSDSNDFSDDFDDTDEAETSFSKGAQFDDRPISRIAQIQNQTSRTAKPTPKRLSKTSNANSSKAKSSPIRLTSTESPGSVWDEVARTAASETTTADWGAGPMLAPPDQVATPSNPWNDSVKSSTTHSYTWNQHATGYGYGNAGNAGNEHGYGGFGFGIGATQPSMPNYPPSGANSGTIPYFNTETAPNASPQQYFGTNSPSGTPMNLGAYGFGYYDPATGQLYANPYGANPYGMNGNMGGFNGGMYGNNSYNPYGTYGAYDPYNPYGGMNGMMEQSPEMQIAWLQAMLRQEALRREVEAENAEEEQAEREQERERTEAEQAAADAWSVNRLMPIQVSSPLFETAVSGLKMLSPFNTPDGPHRGVGRPLSNRSWLDRPYYFGGFVGTIWGDDLVSNLIKQDDGGTGGLILGYNVNEYWGLESRLHFASIDIKETTRGRELFNSWYTALYPDATFIPPLTTRSNSMTTFDLSVHYYPLGNAKFRPFFKYGLGLTRQSFTDTYGQKRHIDTMAMPFGIGLRYWWNERLAIQADLIDNFVFSKDITKTQNNWAISVGLTYSFGTSKKRKPTSYWPYTPSRGSKW